MEALEAIFSRRSIRRYTNAPVSEDCVERLLRAAMSAPSAGNAQPWQFVVIKDREILGRIPSIHPYSHMVTEAPVTILVCGDKSRASYGGIYWVQDCSAATENLLIAARAQGLGAVWLSVYPLEDRISGLRELLGIPADVVPFALIPIGHPAEEKPPADRYDAKRVHIDRW